MKEKTISVVLPLILSFSCIVFALWLLPKNCSLFVSNVPGPQMCHTIPMPKGCFDDYCQDIQTEYISSIIAGFGILLFFVPMLVYIIREFRDQPIERWRILD